MSIIRLSAIGNLDIEINFILRLSEAKYMKFDISKIKSPVDLKEVFCSEENINYDEEKPKINYLDYISLSSKNDFITTLLFINRAFKNKTFVELIMLNQIEFRNETSFLKGLIRKICVKNYFFLVENKIFDIPSSIKFNIKILNDDNDDIISSKSFQLFERNASVYNNEEKDLNLFDKINYNFDNTQFFIANFSEFIKYKNDDCEEISLFYKNLISNASNIKIITIFNENCINTLSEIQVLDLFKDILSYSDYIFSDRKTLNNFYIYYNKIYNDNNYINEENDDLILKDNDKKRKIIERITILLEDLDLFQIYIQKGIKMELIFNESYTGNLIWKSQNEEKEINNIKLINSNKKLLNGIFIGSFLSRLLYGKTMKTCITAGCLSVKNMLGMIKNNINYITDIDLYNVVVPFRKQSKRELIEKELYENQLKLFKQEKGFVLDCTNINASKKKEYNPLMDIYCQNFVFSKNNFTHLKKLGFINKKGNILKDPDLIQNKKYNNTNYQNNKLDFFAPNNIFKNDLLKTKKKQIEGSIYNRTLSSFKSKRPETSINEMSKTNYKRIKTGHNSRRNFLMKNLHTFPLMVNNDINNIKEKNEKKRWSTLGNRFDNSLSEKKLLGRNKSNNKNIWDYGTNNYIDRGLFNKIIESLEKK